MKAYAPLLCLIIWAAPCFAETKQSAPLSIQPETKQSAPLSIQPGTTMLTLNKMCQENANTRDNPKNAGVSVGWAGPLALSLAFPCR